MRKPKNSRPSPRRKRKSCAACRELSERRRKSLVAMINIDRKQAREIYDQRAMLNALCRALERVSTEFVRKNTQYELLCEVSVSHTEANFKSREQLRAELAAARAELTEANAQNLTWETR